MHLEEDKISHTQTIIILRMSYNPVLHTSYRLFKFIKVAFFIVIERIVRSHVFKNVELAFYGNVLLNK